MKTHSFLRSFILLCCMLVPALLSAQDTLIKRNGDILMVKVLEMGTNAVSYKRADFEEGPTFVENNADIFMIKFRNGQKQEFKNETQVRSTDNTPLPGKDQLAYNDKHPDLNKKIPSTTGSDPLRSGPVSDSYRIEQINGKYMMNGQKIGRKELDRQLSRSKNPAVKTGLKAAKTTKTLQKIVGLTSIPSTIAGGITSIVTFANLYSAYNHGTLTPSNYVNTGLSFLGTLSLPVTSKILKKKRDKMYEGLIDLHNATN